MGWRSGLSRAADECRAVPQRGELYAVQRVKTTNDGIGFRYLLHQERTDRLLASEDDAAPAPQ